MAQKRTGLRNIAPLAVVTLLVLGTVISLVVRLGGADPQPDGATTSGQRLTNTSQTIASANDETAALNLATKIAAECIDDVACFNKALTGQLGLVEPLVVFMAFREINKNTSNMNGSCSNVGQSIATRVWEMHRVKALTYREDSCGRSITYGLLQSFMSENPGTSNRTVAAQYCMADSNPPSCFYAVGLALGDLKNGKAAEEVCVGLGHTYDETKDAPVSYQWTAVGDCILGWSGSTPITSRASTMTSLESIHGLCSGMDGRAADLCRGAMQLNFTQASANVAEGTARLEQVTSVCAQDESFECSQFLGKGIDEQLTRLYGVNIEANLTAASRYTESLCLKVNMRGCVTGIVQQRATRSGHDATAGLCRGFADVPAREFCLLTSKNHA